jgi:hypothetical protein
LNAPPQSVCERGTEAGKKNLTFALRRTATSAMVSVRPKAAIKMWPDFFYRVA